MGTICFIFPSVKFLYYAANLEKIWKRHPWGKETNPNFFTWIVVLLKKFQALSNGLNKYAYETSTSDKINNIKLAVFYEDDSETNNKIQKVKLAIMDRLKLNSTWAFQLIFCEILNVVNVVLQVTISLYIPYSTLYYSSNVVNQSCNISCHIYPYILQ